MVKVDRQKSLPTLEIVIPLYNEEDAIDELIGRLQQVFQKETLEKLGIAWVHYLFIDDGSQDKTAKNIKAHIEKSVPATMYRLSRQFGHQAAVSAGIHYSAADLVSVIDADLQDPPEVIPRMVEKWREGYDVIFGVRKKRKENFFKVFCYWAFYRILAFLSEIEVAVDSGDFCLMDKKAVDALRALPERLRFPRGLRSWVGFHQTGITYEREARKTGTSKYSIAKLYALATDGIASSSIRPLQVIQFFSIIFVIVSAVFAFLALQRFLYYPKENEMALWFLLGYCFMSASSFMIMFAIYIMSAYIGRTYLEVKGRPTYVLMEVVKGD